MGGKSKSPSDSGSSDSDDELPSYWRKRAAAARAAAGRARKEEEAWGALRELWGAVGGRLAQISPSANLAVSTTFACETPTQPRARCSTKAARAVRAFRGPPARKYPPSYPTPSADERMGF
jgi:hypothetical protein